MTFTKVIPNIEEVNALEKHFCPDDLPVFQITPPVFQKLAHEAYTLIGRPTISRVSFWNVYKAMIDALGPIQNLEDSIGYSDGIIIDAQNWDEVGGVENIADPVEEDYGCDIGLFLPEQD